MQHFRIVVVAQRLAAFLHLGDAAFDAPHQGILVDAQFDHRVEREPLLCQHAVERLGLRHGAREAVEDEALARVRLLDALADDADHDVVGAPDRRAP